MKKSLCCLFLILSCTAKNNRKEIWMYASSYKEVLAMYEPELKKAFPDFEVKFFQAGSEVVATKIQTELAAGKTKADLLMTSDVFFFHDLAEKGHLAVLETPLLKDLPTQYIQKDQRFVISRFPVMVIAFHTSLPEKDRPLSFADLADPKFKGKLTMPSPLESGTALTSVIFLKRLLGEEYFKKLRQNDILASGGNGATLARVLSRERPVAILLMENVLQAQEKGNKEVQFVVPKEGGIPIPSPLGVLASSSNLPEAKKVFEWFLGDKAQEILVKGWVYSSRPGQLTPNGAPEWSQLKMLPWTLEEMSEWGQKRQLTKDFFQKTVLN